MEKVKYVCNCRKVTFSDLESAVLEGASTVDEIIDKTKASTACGRCAKDVKEIAEHLLENNK